MSTSKSPVPDTDAIMSEQNPSETNQLKRKSHGSSPDPGENGSGDVPNKRSKVDDILSKSPEPNERTGRSENGKGTSENGNKKQQEPAIKDSHRKQDSQSPVARRAMEHNDRPSSPEERRRPSNPRRQDGRSPTGPPDRRTSGARRDSDVRSPPDRRGSESGRRMSSFGAEKDRDKRGSFSQEDKKRGRRLFGGLLSTLSQTTTNSQQKRRHEIEKRQQEKAVQQSREDEKRRSEKLAKLERIRNIEQVRFDEQVMRTQHSNMLAMAHSLRTRSEPRLYYRPWELSPEEEDIIKDQIRDAERQIEEEVKQFKRRKEQRLKDLGALPSSSEVQATFGEQVEERSNNAAPDEFITAATATNDRKPFPTPASKSSHHEDRDHDEVVEAEEDTVIY
ncbi:hypothetical protein VP1G_07051 [Cytospora mali]|uniref:Pinin/SDK/MemA protein domain-containing protein n=1 Tax=Cytospora mali TaxID=578113 RepID=A0A194V768_CYTMA|nr:hypothetical protein VP1G_07051 [Valsa mali var. pyri (nom. inval.)]